jgi:hypothetical protein
MSLLDFYLYFDEDQDLNESEMTEFSPVEAAHVRELVVHGFLNGGEVLSHKGWHHMMAKYNDNWRGSMWDGPTGEVRRYIADLDEWEQ